MRNTLTLILCFLSLALQAKLTIIPQPSQVRETGKVFCLQSGQTIGYSSSQLRPAALYLQEVLTRATGMKMAVHKGEGTYTLVLTDIMDAKDEGYELEVTSDNVRLTARCYRGITNGIATIRQMLPPEIESGKRVAGVEWVMPSAEIVDKPAYSWRGLMLDPARHFITVEETKRMIDVMALYKFNKLHWHLIDDEGWRMEIKKYPELTRKGAWRHTDNRIDNGCMKRLAEENNPDFRLPSFNFKVVGGDSLYGGFYTQKEIREVVCYAAERGLDVVPELDMPGHNSVAQSLMPWLSCTGKVNRVYCLGQDRVMDFCKDIYREAFRLFPYEYMHIGGDEVEREVWKECPKCQQRIVGEGLDGVEQLQAWFTREMEKYFNANGRKLLGWEEILDGGVSKTATIYWYLSKNKDITQRSTRLGNAVVVCPDSYCYFDHGQNDQTLRRVYEADIVPADLTPEQQSLIYGIQANLWGEAIPTEARLQFMAFPRALAVAEKAWTPRSNHRWDSFLPRLTEHLKRLDVMDVHYRPLHSTVK